MRQAVAVVCVLLAAAPLARADEAIADLRQGTNLGVALSPSRTELVVDLVGALWRVPVSGGGAERLTPADEGARSPRISPDGRSVVYQRLENGQWDLWRLDLASREREPLTRTPANERDPEWSADGRSVLFVADRTGHYCVWSLALETRVETQLTEESGDAAFPTVADVGPVAYVLDRGMQSELRVLLSNGTTTPLVTGTRRISAPSWRPGGGVIVFAERASPAQSRLKMLVLGSPQVEKTLSDFEDVFATRPVWLSPAEFLYAADGQLWRREIAVPLRRPVHVNAATGVSALAPPDDSPRASWPGRRTSRGV